MRPTRSVPLLAAVLGLVLVASGSAGAQTRSEVLRSRYEAKLASPFVSKIEWERTFSAAKERARTEKKPILAYFTRSYAP